MRAGKKQIVESGKTRPCIVYVKNLREEAEPAGARLRKRDPRELQKQQREQALRETPSRRPGRPAIEAIQKKPLSRTRQSVAAKSPTATVDSPSPPPKVTRATTATTTPATVMAKRRSTLVLGNSHQKLTSIGGRRGTQTETHATPKMYKQVAKHLAPSSPPPTIAASRSRRSIKPNPKYASEDVVTPKYMASLSGEGSPVSSGSRHRSQAKPIYAEINDLLDLDDEDNDDELADAAFNPQLHKSDEDDDEEFISDGEFEQELRLEKLPAAKRGRGRPPKANNVKTPISAAAASTTAAGASNRVFHKLEVNSSQGRTAPATNMQQLRRTLAGAMARNNASMMADGGGAKRKLEASESESPVARKRLVISSVGGSGQRSVPVVNGATKRSTTPSAHANISRPKVGAAGNASRMQPQRTSEVVFKVNPATPNTSTQNATNTSTRSTRGAGAGGGSGAGAASKSSPKEESEATFTIVNIDDIMNQDDVLISRANSALAAAASRTSGASKKLAKGRLRMKDILSTSNTIGAALEKKFASIEKSTPVSNNNNSSSSQAAAAAAAKRLKILSSNSSSSGNATKPRTASQAAQSAAVSKPRPRILNTEMGKKTQPMKPLMSMGKELCPTDVDTEEDDPDPDLDLDLDLDLDEPPASIVTRRTPRQAPGPATAEPGSAAASNKWSSSSTTNTTTNRRKVLATTASTANARADKKESKLLADVHDEPPVVFKKPGGSPQLRSKENQQEQRDKEDAPPAKKDTASTATVTASSAASATTTVLSSPQKYFPPETTTFMEEEGRLVKKITCYETWHVINLPTELPASAIAARQQRTCLELALVKLANVAARLKVPSSKWSSKVTLYKVSPTLMQRQSMTIFTGDLLPYNIPEEDRHKYQPSCVLFRRTASDRTKSGVPYDRAIIFKNKCFYANIDGKQVNLLGAPETVDNIKEVEILLDIVDRLTLNSQLVEMVNTK
ncbi:serine/arginine repetitive matrix protein 2 [Drosophila kikkawai]|uniref:Mucin-19 n=1 Tax=Drosophila kikkawai TaxID=30033 RepID=A0A6P4IJT1_DROKI|nr:mucin-19 [Drosophila kikkawai]XP_017023007.1 mucin-19 [Drosophila kikkawai]